MKTITHTPATPGQKEQIQQMIKDVSKSDDVTSFLDSLDKREVERIRGNVEFAKSLREFTVGKLQELSLPKQFDDEEVRSSCGYNTNDNPTDGLIKSYMRLRRTLRIGSWNREFSKQIFAGGIGLPMYAEKWVAIPNIWRPSPNVRLWFGETYASAIQTGFAVLSDAYDYTFFRVDCTEISLTLKKEDYLIRESERSQEFFSNLSEAQGDPDILIVPVQLGKHHRGRSCRRARRIFRYNECGLGTFAAIFALAQTPERFTGSKDLHLDCAGDEFHDRGRSRVNFGCCLHFRMEESIYQPITLGAADCKAHDKHSGPASAFLPN